LSYAEKLSAYPECMAEPRYSPEKFDELLVYIADRSKDDPRIGDMKLNKLLYFADVTAFRRTGQPITGARYQHEERGPIARALIKAREKMEGTRLRTEKRDYYGYPQRVTVAIDEPDLSKFTKDELVIVDEVLERFKNMSGTDMEDIAHQEPGWQMTGDSEVIPYRFALLAREASPRAVERGKELAKRFGW
jgi:uncharacterized phage-associated protein